MEISNIKVYSLNQSIKDAGIPKNNEGHIDLARKLGSCNVGTGHDCVLKGITVRCHVKATQYFWMQWLRYHFHDIASSQSKMHKILNFDIDEQCNNLVTEKAKDNLREQIDYYNSLDNPTDLDYERVIANIPMGFNLTASIVTNYLQLKTNITQRKIHTTEEWKEYCRFILSLPYFSYLTGIVPGRKLKEYIADRNIPKFDIELVD